MSEVLFGRYRLDALLGRGGMGEVYRAFDLDKRRVVALKLLRPEHAANGLFRARFQEESRLVAQLSEPHVIPIHDYGELDGRLYIDMRFVPGPDLAQLLEAGPLPADRAVRIVGHVAAALDAAHAAGLVHRDVKPSNVLVANASEPSEFCYLVDFGVSRAVDAGPSSIATGEVIGTPAYMAPERFSGNSADPRSDVYSLSCLLYEALTGAAPFTAAESMALPFAHMTWPRPRPSATRPGLESGLDDVVARGMAPDPAGRFGTAGTLAGAAAASLGSAPALEPSSGEGPAPAGSTTVVPGSQGAGPDGPPVPPQEPVRRPLPSSDRPPPGGRRHSRRAFLVGTGGLVVGGIAATVIASRTGSNPSPPATGGAGAASTIRVGIAGEAPYGFVGPDGRLGGEAPTVARAVLARLGIHDLVPVQVPFASLIPALTGNHVDIIAAGMFITAERCRRVAYSVPDFIAPTAFLVPAGNPQRIRTFDDVRITGARLAILSGGIEEEHVRGANIPAAQVVLYESSAELIDGVVAGSTDAAALTNIALQSQIDGAGPGVLEISNTSYYPEVAGKPDVGAGAFAFRPSDSSVREAFDRELLNLQASGEWLTLTQPFGMTAANLPPRDLDTPTLCGSS